MTKKQRHPASSSLYIFLGLGSLIILWWLLSILAGPLLISSPYTTIRALFTMLRSPIFYENIFWTATRILGILLFAGTGGIFLAAIALFDKRLEESLEPFRWICMTIPPVVMIVVIMFWMGVGSNMIIVFGSLILWPIMYVNILQGSRIYTEELRETAKVFDISPKIRLRHFFLPAIAPALLAGAVQVICSAIRATVLAEVLGAEKGIGAAIATYARQLNTERMTAWVVIVLLMAVAAEFLLLRPISKKAYQWRNHT